MKKLFVIYIAIVLFTWGCNEVNSITEINPTDSHPTSILSIRSNGLLFETEKSFAIVSIGDTIRTEVVAYDQDLLVSYKLIHVNNLSGQIFLSTPNDTLIARFGFIADTSIAKPNRVVEQTIIINDALGFTKEIKIGLYIKI